MIPDISMTKVAKLYKAEKDATIAEKDATIAEKDATIVEKDAAIAEKDATIVAEKAKYAKLKRQSSIVVTVGFYFYQVRQ